MNTQSRSGPTMVAENLSVRFGGVKALRNVSLTFQPGSVYGMIGPNGSGKTTLLNTLSGVVRPTEGAIRIEGSLPRRYGPEIFFEMGVARTFQLIRVVDDMTVRENVAAGADYAGRRPVPSGAKPFSHADQVADAISRLRLQNYSDMAVGLLPYGLQRRVEIARAIAGRPRVLLLDEPMAGMNNQERADVAAAVRAVISSDMTLIIVEHDIDLLVGLSDELIVLNFGEVIARGPPKETARLDVVRSAYLGAHYDFAS